MGQTSEVWSMPPFEGKTAEDRAKEALRLVEASLMRPVTVLDPVAVIKLLAWVIDGEPRPMSPTVARDRGRQIAQAIQAGSEWQIAAPVVG